MITSALNKREKAELNTLLRRLMLEFERRDRLASPSRAGPAELRRCYTRIEVVGIR